VPPDFENVTGAGVAVSDADAPERRGRKVQTTPRCGEFEGGIGATPERRPAPSGLTMPEGGLRNRASGQ
jgi:hypothetical protein